MNFLNLEDKTFLITGVNNKKSVATFTAQVLQENGASLIFSVQNENQIEFCKKKFPDSLVIKTDLSQLDSIKNLVESLPEPPIDGVVHSVAFARFESASFHETSFEEFSEALRISAYSLVELSNALKTKLSTNASIVTVSISNLRATNYGYMGPIKALLSSSIDYLAKSFSEFSQVRFNSVAAGPLKTSAAAGIPTYVENYLYCEQLTLRKKNLDTQEVADTIAFLLSTRSSGINASEIVVDAGMNVNYFDQKVVKDFSKSL